MGRITASFRILMGEAHQMKPANPNRAQLGPQKSKITHNNCKWPNIRNILQIRRQNHRSSPESRVSEPISFVFENAIAQCLKWTCVGLTVSCCILYANKLRELTLTFEIIIYSEEFADIWSIHGNLPVGRSYFLRPYFARAKLRVYDENIAEVHFQ